MVRSIYFRMNFSDAVLTYYLEVILYNYVKPAFNLKGMVFLIYVKF